MYKYIKMYFIPHCRQIPCRRRTYAWVVALLWPLYRTSLLPACLRFWSFWWAVRQTFSPGRVSTAVPTSLNSMKTPLHKYITMSSSSSSSSFVHYVPSRHQLCRIKMAKNLDFLIPIPSHSQAVDFHSFPFLFPSLGFISQFYLHTPRSSANRMNHTCLCLPSRSWYSFTDPGGMDGWVGLGWLVGYIPK